MTNWSSVGRKSRRRGDDWERAAIPIVVRLTGHNYWRRTKRGETQIHGDLLPVSKDGLTISRKMLHRFHIECKYRTRLNRAELIKWIREVLTITAGGPLNQQIFLILRLAGGVTLVFDDDFIRSVTVTCGAEKLSFPATVHFPSP